MLNLFGFCSTLQICREQQSFFDKFVTSRLFPYTYSVKKRYIYIFHEMIRKQSNGLESLTTTTSGFLFC